MFEHPPDHFGTDEFIAWARAAGRHPQAAFLALELACARATEPRALAAALRATGDWYLAVGLVTDAISRFEAALQCWPDDLATVRLLVEVHFGVRDWAVLLGQPDGTIPAELRVDTAIAFGIAVHRQAGLSVHRGHDAEAAAVLEDAGRLMVTSVASVPLGSLSQVHVHAFPAVLAVVQDAARAARLAPAIDALGRHLCDNDESAKALALLLAVPHTLADHPLIAALSRRVEPVRRHLSDPEQYARAYSGPSLPSGQRWLSVDSPPRALKRVEWAVDLVRRRGADTRVLEVGCYDGITGLRLAASCPGIRYVGTDLGDEVLARFRAQVQGEGVELSTVTPDELFDFVLWFEVIEHVPDPVIELRNLALHLAPGGQLLVSTPWGSYDRGHPPLMTELGTERGICGHVRAMTPRDLLQVAAGAGLHCLELFCTDHPYQRGRTMHASLAPEARSLGRPRVNFVVPPPLWPCNALVR